MVAPGTLLADKYLVERILGRGGMGMVVSAMHVQLQQPVAVKLLLPELASRQDVVDRFLREARASVRLKGEHVARVSDVGSLADGTPFMVMELLDGHDLEAMIRTRGPLPAGEAVDYMLQICEAMAEAHAVGIVHRDLKPANCFLTRRPDGSPLIKVLDFGISKALGDPSAQLTATNSMMGTPAYMAPEQLRDSRSVDGRTDVWALGVILYEALSGARPFEAEAFGELFLAVISEPPKPLSVPLPPRLSEVVMRCLEKDPASRFQSVAELASALAAFAANASAAALCVERSHAILQASDPAVRARMATPVGGVPMATPSDRPATPAGPHTTLASSAGMIAPSPTRSPRVWIGVGAIALIAAGAIAIATLGRGGSTSSAAPAVAPAAAPAIASPPPVVTAPPAPTATSVTEPAPTPPAATPPTPPAPAPAPPAPPRSSTPVTKPASPTHPKPARPAHHDTGIQLGPDGLPIHR